MSLVQLTQARLDTVLTVEWQQVVLAELATRCAAHQSAVDHVSKLVDHVMTQTQNSERGFAFAAELLASLGLGSVERVEPSNTKFAAKFRSPRPSASPTTSGTAKSAATERAQQVVDRMYKMSVSATEMMARTERTPREAWLSLWCPVLNGLARLCVHPTRDVRYSAFGILQRLLFSPNLTTSDGDEYLLCMDRVLLPMHARLSVRAVADASGTVDQQSQTLPLSDVDASEVRTRAFTILGSFFLHHLPRLLDTREMRPRWTRILDIAEEYLQPDRPEHATEAVREQLKNMLLVIHASEGFGTGPSATPAASAAALLGDEKSETSVESGDDNQDGAAPSDDDKSSKATAKRQRLLWRCTWPRVDELCPGLRAELFPPPPPPVATTEAEQSAAAAAAAAVEAEQSTAEVAAEVESSTAETTTHVDTTTVATESTAVQEESATVTTTTTTATVITEMSSTLVEETLSASIQTPIASTATTSEQVHTGNDGADDDNESVWSETSSIDEATPSSPPPPPPKSKKD
ncbi:hypothetical protein THASP1DRAFT_32817 [Thamnocephalis sphaerospora]|uniref:GBF1-like tetratricopeptide repeats domain-containing protein n=1 Tax=Thamnocephalis sphaerospora TaxID=78915 RepID=A0A4V1IVV1_9FUNG|nr:hypothetical protein THASP1DRAFT_32817 [Thamnocephalis sphaerospora]|eukprot:RKP05339.1 hypothetical protein THASP1DRAFT_32817 [Thamnocephalis sphaerospora]